MPYGLEYAVVLATGGVIALIVTPLMGRLGLRLKIVATPGGRRRHTGVISRLGGLGLALGFFGALLVSRFLQIPTARPQRDAPLLGIGDRCGADGDLWSDRRPL